MEIFDKTFSALERKLDLHFKRHMLLSSNVANSETPNFKARELDFSGELQKALGTEQEELKKTNVRHMDISRAQGNHVVSDYSGAMGADGNNVDLDLAMGKLSENSRAYQNGVSMLEMKLRMLRMAARGTGGL